jgi:beta-D-galactosyl-(1->4)-L-rhamnose phosphorylase
MNIRRALLRQCVDRIGLGGYLSLTLPFPEFNDYIAQIADEFRAIKELHKSGPPAVLKPKAAVLTAWGKLRSWTLSGHFHETYMHELIHVIESLSGLPLDVRFISFEDVANGVPGDVDVIINAGAKGSAWSGGDYWKDDNVVGSITRWVHGGGAFIGIGEPSATDGYDTLFRLAHILGVDKDNGEYVCHGKWPISREVSQAAQNTFGKGMGIYMPSYSHCYATAHELLNLILRAARENPQQKYISSNPCVDCAYYPARKTLALVNNTGEAQKTTVLTESGETAFELEAFELRVASENI